MRKIIYSVDEAHHSAHKRNVNSDQLQGWKRDVDYLFVFQ